ncbi:intraflagellar transport protein Oseg4 isoform X2 [Tachypleus tridentatus]|uniref:intraflagellar transport protein Oseg4 isoform X2 n=1 Tax=Tachypleus tridentatus TaxID=6853 RepID=UPI003FD2A91D
MFIYLSKKIAIPNNTFIQCLAWNKEQGYIACGGEEGLLKVLKLEMGSDGKVRGLAAPSNLSMNQTLEGHGGTVQVVTWNESYQKLTSSDQNGLIIVWMLYKGSWYEEMINNRNKSVVRGMAWNSDGQKICIVYEDGAVIVGSVDGNRIWGKELKGIHLSSVEWSPDGKFLLFGMQNGEIHVYEHNGNFVAKLGLPCLQNLVSRPNLIGIHWYNGRGGFVDQDTPVLAVGYDNGSIQLMRHETDEEPILIETDMSTTSLQWNHNGTVLAITGKQFGGDSEKRNIVKFFSPEGKHLHSLRVPGKEITACAWEGGGLRIALAVDSFIFFANIRPDYKWCYFSNTIAYAFNQSDRTESTVVFWNTHNNEKYVKYVKHLLTMAACGEFCSLATKADDSDGQYALILCNAIGTPVDSRYVEMEVCFVTMTSTYVIATSRDTIYVWHFRTPKGRTIVELGSQKSMSGQERLYHVDETPSGTADAGLDIQRAFERKRRQPTNDPISCITSSEKMLIIGRESGTFQRYALPLLALTHKYNVACHPVQIALNSNSCRISIIDILGMLALFDLEAKSIGPVGKEVQGEKLPFERKDVWDVVWASDNSEMFAFMEKTRMYIFRDLDPEEPVMCSGYMYAFVDLQVKAVLLDELMENPDNPALEYLISNEVKSLRDSKDLLEKVGIVEASQFIEDNSHPKLWHLLAEAALKKLDFSTAETAYVRCKDYQGIELVKRVFNLQNENLRKAEVALYFRQFDEAEKLYLEMDRRENAVTYYEQGHNQEKLVECYYMLEDYDSLEKLMKSLPENHKLLSDLGVMFTSVGMCIQAVDAYTKANKIKAAIECCVALSQWNTAIYLAQKHNVQEIDGLLSKYARYLMDKKKIMSAVELYRKAHRFLDAAKMVSKIAEVETHRNTSPLCLKKLHVLAALLVEEHHAHLRETTRSAKGKAGRDVSSAIASLLDNEALMFSDTRIVDQPWRGAEAYHFLLLAQRQLYEGYVDAAMKTSLYLRKYEDILNQEMLYALLALASCANRAFGTCSKAFIKLESLETLSEEHREEYENLALEIFMKHPPKDARNTKAECTTCETMIPDWCNICPSCNTRFPICVATGRPIMDTSQKWTCSRCKRHAHKQDLITRQHCPLCHNPCGSD